MPRHLLLAATALWALPGLASATTPAAPADMVLIHGAIHTIDAADHVQEALAIKDGRIVYVGTTKGAAAWEGPQTRTIDLNGRVVMPGLIDGHMHPLDGGAQLLACNLNYAPLTIPQMQAAIQKCLDKDGPGQDDKWLVVVNWFQEAMQPAGVQATSALLDALPTKRPILVQSSFGHSSLANSRALAIAGITAATKDPAGGVIHHDAKGEPTGLLDDFAQNIVSDHIPAPTAEENKAAARAALAAMAQQGVTQFLNALTTPEALAAFTAVQQEGGLTARGHFAPLIEPKDGPAPDAVIARIVALRKTYDQGPLVPAPGITVRNVKMFLDGVITAPALTGVMLAPYFVNKGTDEKPDWQPGTSTGPALYFPQPVLNPLVEKLAALGFDAHMHADGDGAVRNGLDAVAALRKAHPEYDTRPAIAHDEQVDPADYPRYKALNVVPVLSFQWEKEGADTEAGERNQLGPLRYARAEPSGLLLSAGAPIAYGSDWPVDPLNEWFALKVGVTRMADPESGAQYQHPLEGGPALSVEQAVRAITMGSAYELRADTVTGSLEAGKFADLIVIDRDIFHGDPNAIAGTKVLLTMVGGKVVYTAPEKP